MEKRRVKQNKILLKPLIDKVGQAIRPVTTFITYYSISTLHIITILSIIIGMIYCIFSFMPQVGFLQMDVSMLNDIAVHPEFLNFSMQKSSTILIDDTDRDLGHTYYLTITSDYPYKPITVTVRDGSGYILASSILEGNPSYKIKLQATCLHVLNADNMYCDFGEGGEVITDESLRKREEDVEYEKDCMIYDDENFYIKKPNSVSIETDNRDSNMMNLKIIEANYVEICNRGDSDDCYDIINDAQPINGTSYHSFEVNIEGIAGVAMEKIDTVALKQRDVKKGKIYTLTPVVVESGKGELKLAQSSLSQDYVLNMRERIVFKPTDKNRFEDTLLELDENHLYYSGTVTQILVNGYNLMPTFWNWFIQNIYLLPITILCAVFSAFIALNKENKTICTRKEQKATAEMSDL